MSKQKQKWCCPYCSQRSARHWNLNVHIKRRHNGIGEPIDEEQSNEIRNKMSNQFFYHNHPYSVNYLSAESQKGKEKERDIIDEIYQMVIEQKEKGMKIKEIKSFFIEHSSLSSSSQQPVTSLIQTPIIQPIIPSVTKTMPLQQTPLQPAQSSEEQRKIIINPGTDLITSTFMAEDLQRRARGEVEGEGEDSIIIPQEPSLYAYMMTTTSDDNNNNNNNNCKKRVGEPNPTTENTKEQEPEEDRNDIEEHPLSKSNLLIDNEDDDIIKNNIDYDDDSSNIDCYDNSSDISMVIKRDKYGDIYEWYKV
jgi:hypothetical protein